MARFDVERFIEAMKQARADGDGQRSAEEVLRQAAGDPGAILAALGEPKQAGIHPLHQSPELTILNVVWAPFMVLLPHEHKMWASIGVYTGREDNIVWRRKGSQIEAHGAAALAEKQVFGLPLDAVHSVINPIPRLTGAIHVYGGDFFATPRSEWDPETLRERPFDLDAARRSFAEANARFHAVR